MLCRTTGFKPERPPLPQDESFNVSKPGKGIICRQCGYLITMPENIISINGSHKHTFTNPAGITFEIGCFSDAPGCLIHGIPTSEFTWFEGYQWNYAHCAGCLTHLGWFYQGRDDSFFGLILESLLDTTLSH